MLLMSQALINEEYRWMVNIPDPVPFVDNAVMGLEHSPEMPSGGPCIEYIY